MKMSRIVEELERQGIEMNYVNIAIFMEFVSQEGLSERLRLNERVDDDLTWLRELFEPQSK